jgi:Tol biopolymer transport system component
MAKTKHFGALAAAVGAIVAAALLVLVLVVVKPQPGRAALPGTNGLIAYSGIDPIDGDREIFAIHPDLGGSQGRQLTFNDTMDTNPCYSPDGNRIGYLGRTANNDSQIFTIPATGGQPAQVTPNTVMNPTDCSFTGPRGTHIVYSAYDGQDREIYTIPADGGTPTQLTSTRGPNVDPDYRPDGQSIVYAHQQWTHSRHPKPLDYEIATRSATGVPGGQILTSTSSDERDPVYSPNGQQIAYSSTGGVFGDSTDYEIWTIPATGGEPVQVSFNNTSDLGPSWQPQLLVINEISQVVDAVRNQREGRGTRGAKTR